MRTRILAWALSLLALCAIINVPAATASVVSCTATTRASCMPWQSGAYIGGHSAPGAEAFANWRDHGLDAIAVFPSREKWGVAPYYSGDSLLNTWWYQALPASFNAARDNLVVAIPLWPHSKSLADSGTDSQWQLLAQQIAAKDPNAWIRLGWEMNIASWWALTNANYNDWDNEYRRVVTVMRSVAPSLRFTFNPNRGTPGSQACTIPTAEQCLRDTFHRVKSHTNGYAIDIYDSFPAMKSASAKDIHLNAWGRLNESLAFAKSQGMKLAIPEWGVACNDPGCSWAGSAGGDNPEYIKTYMDWFAANAAHLEFEIYFDDPIPSMRHALDVNPIGPNAPAMYRSKMHEYDLAA